jgi:hypothetical protein
MLILELHALDVSISLNNKNPETRKPKSDCLHIFLNLFKDTGRRTRLPFESFLSRHVAPIFNFSLDNSHNVE